LILGILEHYKEAYRLSYQLRKQILLEQDDEHVDALIYDIHELCHTLSFVAEHLQMNITPDYQAVGMGSHPPEPYGSN
jgi:hypothetical protein